MKIIPTHKILLVLMFWEGDKAQAMKLARLLADLEPGHSNEADFLFVNRFDCSHDEPTIRFVSRKFNVFKHTSQRRGTGWPHGCNAIFFGSLEWIYRKMEAAQVPHYKAVVFLGADGAPLRRDWISIFVREWKKANEETKICMAGALIKDPAYHHDHINGDCAMMTGDLDFLKWLTLGVGDVSVTAGWDWVLSRDFQLRGWADFPFVRSVWNRRTDFTEKNWQEETELGTVWFHGQKNFSLLEMSRKKLL
jgi:hypothetical protein